MDLFKKIEKLIAKPIDSPSDVIVRLYHDKVSF